MQQRSNKKYEVKQLKNLVTRKTAGLLAFLMVFSLVLPIAAFAANGFNTLTNNSGTVTGRVYIDEATYTSLSGDKSKIQLFLFGKDKAIGLTSAVYATYSTYKPTVASDTYYYYDVNASLSGVSLSDYPVRFAFKTAGASTYVYSNELSHSGFGGGFFPGPIPGGTNSDGSISPDAAGNVDATALRNALANGGTAIIKITGENAILPASALTGSTGTIQIVTDEGVTYTIPVSAIDLQALATSLGVAVNNLSITVSIAQLTGAAAQGVADAVSAEGATQVAAAVDFKIVASGNGKTQTLDKLPVYISRGLPLTEVVSNPNTVTGVVYTPGEGIAFVPTTVDTADGKSVATLKRNGNSIYTVVKVSAKSFNDLTGHWAKADIDKLAGKLVIEGTSATTFEPKRSITRAEVAALIVRSLGLSGTTVTNSTYNFSDVTDGRWYSDVVTAAAEAGIINGYTDGTFKPNAAITRRDLAAMVVRAQAYAGKTVTLTDAQVSQALAGYTDAATLGGQRVNVAIAVSSGLMKGQTGTKLAGLDNTNRAEAATLIARLLQGVDFID